MARLREVVEEHRFRREARAFGLELAALDDAIDGLKWELARDPERGVPAGAASLWAVPIYPRGGRELLVYYAFDERQVRLISIISGYLL